MTVCPFIFLKTKSDRDDRVLIFHEKIHIRQQVELLILPFFLVYFLEFLIRLILYRNAQKAYRNISFEREAHQNDTDFNYLKKRKFWNFLAYFRVS